MKKRYLSLALALVLGVAILSGCSSGNQNRMYGSPNHPTDPSASPSNVRLAEATSMAEVPITGNVTDDPLQKLIYSGNLDIETLDFDNSIESLLLLIKNASGFVEASSVSGGGYNSDGTPNIGHRIARYTVRVPKASFSSLMENGSSLGAVREQASQTVNITPQYADTDLQLSTYKIQRDKLMEMLKTATTMADMITIESRISELQYKIDSTQSQLKNWDTQVSYSSINLVISEVLEYSPTPKEGFVPKVASALSGGVKSFGNTIESIIVSLIYYLPYIIIILIAFFFAKPAICLLRKKRKHTSTIIENPPDTDPVDTTKE